MCETHVCYRTPYVRGKPGCVGNTDGVPTVRTVLAMLLRSTNLWNREGHFVSRTLTPNPTPYRQLKPTLNIIARLLVNTRMASAGATYAGKVIPGRERLNMSIGYARLVNVGCLITFPPARCGITRGGRSAEAGGALRRPQGYDYLL